LLLDSHFQVPLPLPLYLGPSGSGPSISFPRDTPSSCPLLCTPTVSSESFPWGKRWSLLGLSWGWVTGDLESEGRTQNTTEQRNKAPLMNTLNLFLIVHFIERVWFGGERWEEC
jgi:hypothetical protein